MEHAFRSRSAAQPSDWMESDLYSGVTRRSQSILRRPGSIRATSSNVTWVGCVFVKAIDLAVDDNGESAACFKCEMYHQYCECNRWGRDKINGLKVIRVSDETAIGKPLAKKSLARRLSNAVFGNSESEASWPVSSLWVSLETAAFLYKYGGDEPNAFLETREPEEANGEIEVAQEENASLNVSHEVELMAEAEETICEEDKQTLQFEAGEHEQADDEAKRVEKEVPQVEREGVVKRKHVRMLKVWLFFRVDGSHMSILNLIPYHCYFHVFRGWNVHWMVCTGGLRGLANAVHPRGCRMYKRLLG
jgi:hypothetical protein